MYNWTHYNPVKVLFGPGRLNDLHRETLPGKKALIVTSYYSPIRSALRYRAENVGIATI